MNEQTWTPGALLETSGGYWKSCTLHAAVALDLFSCIANQGSTSREIARKIDGDERGTATLLHALVAMGLLEQSDGFFVNTGFGNRFLVKASPDYIGHIISHHHHLAESWANLDQAVRSGKPVRSRSSHSDAQTRESFLMGMFNLAMGIAPNLVKQVDLSDRRRLLDLGGGPGTYAIHFCLQNPGLKAVVFDLPDTQPFAEKTIERFKLADRVTFQAGDFLETTISGTFDVAWLSHILHGEGPAQCTDILKKAAACLTPGGRLYIHEFILDNSMNGPLFPALFSLNMLLGTPRGRAYSGDQLGEMLKQAGCGDIRRLSFQGPNDSGVMVGVKT